MFMQHDNSNFHHVLGLASLEQTLARQRSRLLWLREGDACTRFPLRYLGLPLGLRKPMAAQLQYLVDAVADRLPSWRASMLNRTGRLELVRSTVAAMSIFAMMSLDV
jgi:hypothetical protein